MKRFLIICICFISCQQNNKGTTKETDTTNKIATTATTITDTAAEKEKSIAADRLIVPGESIGKTHLGMDAALLQDLLGKPDMSDAAMGKAWLTWRGKRDEHNNVPQLNIYTTYKDSTMREKTVQQIRSTSSYFSTQNKIHVYSSLKEITQLFPDIKKAAQYNDDGRNVVIYDEQQQGIAFEIASANEQQICTGIIVHKKGENVTAVYMFLHPDMQRF